MKSCSDFINQRRESVKKIKWLGHGFSPEQQAQIGDVGILLLSAGQLKPIGERQFGIDEEG